VGRTLGKLYNNCVQNRKPYKFSGQHPKRLAMAPLLTT
jgi:hypothetical protein